MVTQVIMLQAYDVHLEVHGLSELQSLIATGNTMKAAINVAVLDARRKWPKRALRACAIIPVPNP